MKAKVLALPLAGALLLAGCAEAPNQSTGAVIGGLTGALVGNSVGRGSGRTFATLFGAMVGAMAGSAIGQRLDEADRRYAANAVQSSLDDGRETTWHNPRSGHRGRFRPKRTYRDEHARACREFDHTIWIDGEPEIASGTACQRRDGSWQIIG